LTFLRRVLYHLWHRERFSTKSFWKELSDNLKRALGHYTMEVSPNWYDVRARAQFEAYVRTMKYSQKRAKRLERYLSNHYRTVYSRTKKSATLSRSYRDRLWKVVDRDYISGVQ
jgi:hypothetical protein